MHIHVTETTHKLLDRKIYETQERPKMMSNGSPPLTTYFILNKRDRSGKLQSRPFQQVLEQLKQQEMEEAKTKQSQFLKNGHHDIPSSPKENGSMSYSKTIESFQQSSLKKSSDSDATSSLGYNSYSKSKISNGHSVKTQDRASESPISGKSLPGHIRSRTCEIL